MAKGTNDSMLVVGAVGVVVSMVALHAGNRVSSPGHSTNSSL